MLAAGNYGVVEIRLDHNVRGITVDNLPCAAVCTESEGFTNAEGKVVLSVDVYHGAAFHTPFKVGAGNIIFCAFGVFIFRKRYGNVLISAAIKIAGSGYFAFHGNAVGKVAADCTKCMCNSSILVFGSGRNGHFFNIEILNLAEEFYGCALGCSYSVINKRVKNEGLLYCFAGTFAESVVDGKCNAISFGKLLVKSDFPVIKQCIAVCEKKSRSHDEIVVTVVVDVLSTGNNALHFAGHNVDGVIADFLHLGVLGVVVDSYKGHLLLAVNRLAVRADFYADRCFKGHSAEVVVVLGINRAVGIHTGRNGDFVNMVIAAYAFINNLVGCKGVLCVLVAVEGYVDSRRSNVQGDGVLFIPGCRESIAAVNAFAVAASGAGFLAGADNIVALCTFYGFGVIAVVFGNIGGMFLVSGAGFLAGADNFAALFAGNGYGVVTVALCGVGSFGFGADVVALLGRENSNNSFFYLAFRNVYISGCTAKNLCSELCFCFCCYIFFCSKYNSRNSFARCNSALHVHIGKANLKIAAVFIGHGVFSYCNVAVIRSNRLYSKQICVEVKPCFKSDKP